MSGAGGDRAGGAGKRGRVGGRGWGTRWPGAGWGTRLWLVLLGHGRGRGGPVGVGRWQLLGLCLPCRITDMSKVSMSSRPEPGYENMDHFSINVDYVAEMLRTIEFQTGAGTGTSAAMAGGCMALPGAPSPRVGRGPPRPTSCPAWGCVPSCAGTGKCGPSAPPGDPAGGPCAASARGLLRPTPGPSCPPRGRGVPG